MPVIQSPFVADQTCEYVAPGHGQTGGVICTQRGSNLLLNEHYVLQDFLNQSLGYETQITNLQESAAHDIRLTTSKGRNIALGAAIIGITVVILLILTRK